ncbi:DUF3821 domain-containing protein [Methanoculleus sp. FWC-SCC1]|uniref:DUF3821 domain-containing protein n=1 Tax=Methanoculleus frigidifontis TaxID=2584085 RepID=A0ABT8ME06_9EURY|nr:MEMAR_RS02690 family S-layer glycoprotein [Methanoculleus sp. FWC-SCC1]MDN7026172.1 DUF3821 domain-containing protein [Methanoculleus sp. FWC-SCC1]
MKSITKTMVVAFVVLMAVSLLVAPAAARTVTPGSTIYVGEEGLDLTGVNAGITRLVHYSDFTAGAADNIIDIPTPNDYELTATDVGGITGTYYAWNAAGIIVPNVFVVVKEADVTLDVVLNNSRTDSVAGKSVSRDTVLAFKIQNNVGGLYTVVPNATMNIDITTPGGGTLRQFGGVSTAAVPINASTIYVAGIDLSGVEAGTYTAQAKWTSGNFSELPDSGTVSFEVTTKALAIESNKDSVIRGNNFVVTITGESNKMYYVYIKDASLNGNEYPQIAPGQPSVVPGTTVPVAEAANFTFTKANVTTNAAGTRTVQFNTNSTTDDQSFTLKVLDPTDASKSDDVKVRVEKGSVTLAASGTGVYYIGEEITLSGTNTDNVTTYLFLTGPNLGVNGVQVDNVGTAVTDGVANTFTSTSVETDDTWEYKWDTSTLGEVVDSGTYTIYAVADPRNKANLANVQYATQSVVLKTPFITATASASSVAKGDELTVSGTAEGNPNNVFVWVFGKNFRSLSNSASVESDGSFEYDLDSGITSTLASGQYFVVVQHPMMDGTQDVAVVAGTAADIDAPGMTAVNLSNLQASDAATALVDALNSPNVDDTYTKLTFLVEEPWIRIDTIGDQSVGSTFTLTGTTNLATGDELLIDVTSASFQPTEKTQAAEFSGASGTVSIQQGEPYNTWSFEVDASSFQPDEYIVNVESVETGTTQTTTFNVVTGPVTTPTVTPTGGETTAPTTAATTAPTTAPTTTTPGFGAIIALIGLGAVAVLVLRRN